MAYDNLCWFNRKTKYKKDALVFEWFKYAGMKRTKKVYLFCLPYIDDGTNVVPEAVRKHMLCSWEFDDSSRLWNKKVVIDLDGDDNNRCVASPQGDWEAGS